MGTRAALTVQTVSRTGFNVSAANKTTIASADGVYFVNTGKEFCFVENTHNADVTLTITVSRTVDGLTVPNRTYTLEETTTAGDIIMIGPFPTDVYNKTGGQVWLDVNVDAKVKVIAAQFTPAS